MAKSKYNPDRVDAILNAIRSTGRDEDGWKVGGISKETFYSWINQHPDFSDGVKAAKKEWSETCPETLIRQANKAFADYLFGRMTRVHYTKETGVNVRTGEPYEKEIVQHIPVGVPRWAIERVLGKPLDVLEAVKTLAEAGILPKWITQAVSNEIGSARKGITEVLAGVLPDSNSERHRPGLSEETASIIRAHILGVESANSASLPTAMVGGQEQDQNRGEV